MYIFDINKKKNGIKCHRMHESRWFLASELSQLIEESLISINSSRIRMKLISCWKSHSNLMLSPQIRKWGQISWQYFCFGWSIFNLLFSHLLLSIDELPSIICSQKFRSYSHTTHRIRQNRTYNSEWVWQTHPRSMITVRVLIVAWLRHPSNVTHESNTEKVFFHSHQTAKTTITRKKIYL